MKAAIMSTALILFLIALVVALVGCMPPLDPKEIEARMAACRAEGGYPSKMVRAFGSDQQTVRLVSCSWAWENKYIEDFKVGDKKP